MRRLRILTAAVFFCPTALAASDTTSGVQILIDLQDPAQISKTFCVEQSKLYSVDAQVCISATVKMTCTLVDANDASKGVKWVVSDEKQRCR